jgi:hypothetical protein
MESMLLTGSGPIDAERAFARELRARRFAALARALRPGRRDSARLAVYEEGGPAARRELREIPLAAIRGTLEPSRAALFDGCFRPAARAARRWQRVWLADQRGTPLPPISVVRAGGGFAVRDGHHRVSVARARGALAIDAAVESVQGA